MTPFEKGHGDWYGYVRHSGSRSSTPCAFSQALGIARELQAGYFWPSHALDQFDKLLPVGSESASTWILVAPSECAEVEARLVPGGIVSAVSLEVL